MTKLGAGGWIGLGLSALGIYSQYRANKANRKEAQKARDQQLANQKELNEQQKNHQLDIWNKTNYSAQVEEMKKAGLNPALMYGMGGGSGGSLGNVGGGSAGMAQAHNESTMKGMAIDPLTLAQIENIKADTEQKKAQTDNTNADTTIKDYQAEFDKVRNEVQNESKWDQINSIKAEAQKLLGEANEAGVKGSIAERTQLQQAEKIINEAELSVLMLEATKEGTRLTREQADAIQQQIAQGWEKLQVEREGQDVSRENMEKLAETMLWQSGIQATGNVINSIIDIRKMKWSKNFDNKNRPTEQRGQTINRDKRGNVTGSQETWRSLR